MQTIKTAVVVVLLLFVIYGGFVALNGTNTTLNPELENLVDLNTTTPDISGVTGPFTASSSPASSSPASSSAPSSDPWAAFNSAPSAGFGSPASSAAIPQSSSLELPTSNLPNSNAVLGNATFPTMPIADSASMPSPGLLTGASSPSSAGSTLPPLPNTKDGTNPPSVPDFGIALPTPKQSAFDSTPPTPTLTTDSAAPSLATAADLVKSTTESPTLSASAAGQAFENAKETAMQQANRGQLKEALATLSVFYNAKELTSEQRQDLLDILDALAGEVIYSREHFLEIAYVATKSETVEQIAKRYEIPGELMARINAVEANAPLAEGTKIKVVPGPFRAEVDLQRGELTVFVGELYAGRYPVSTGSDPEPKAGVYQVIDKQRDRNYYGNGTPIAGTDPQNPYGGFWIDLGQELCIHGTSAAGSSKAGCISLAPMDASDVFGMLARGSQITIRR